MLVRKTNPVSFSLWARTPGDFSEKLYPKPVQKGPPSEKTPCVENYMGLGEFLGSNPDRKPIPNRLSQN